MLQNGNKYNPLFLGLTHIGQVFSTCWRKKVGICAVYDFNKNRLEKFKNQNFLNEEPGLNNLKKKCKFEILNNPKEIINYKVIFFTIDTSLICSLEGIILSFSKNSDKPLLISSKKLS